MILNNNALGGAALTANRQTSGQFAVNGRGSLVNSFVLYPQQHAFLYCYDGTNWQVFVSGMGANGVVYQKDYSAQTSAITTVTAFTAPANGHYTLTYVVDCQTTVSTATATPTIGWTDPSGTAQGGAQTAATCTTLGSASFKTVVQPMNVGSGQTVTFSVAIANSPHYNFGIKIEGPW